VVAFTKDPKRYFSFDSTLAEKIRFIANEEKKIWAVGDYMLNFFEAVGDSVEDIFYYRSPDHINDLYVHSLDGGPEFQSILATSDKRVTVLV
jgi:hypothetical protein